MSDVKDQESSQNDEQKGADNGTDNGNEQKQLTYEELQSELAKVRREAAGKRVANKELENELDAFRKWKESQMSDLEKAQTRLKEIEDARIQDALEIAQTKYGLEDDDLEFIHGKTKEEILASAKKYSERQGRNKGTGNDDSEDRTPPNPNLFPGTRGEPVGRNTADHNARLREQLLGGRI